MTIDNPYFLLDVLFYPLYIGSISITVLDVEERNFSMAYVITDDCIQCGACESECPEGAIAEVSGLYVIDASKCQDCGSCADVCPTGAAQSA